MELAAIITTLVVVLLQIITLSIVLGTRKMVRELSSQKSNASAHGDRRDRDFRHNRRPSQDNRPKAQPQGTTTAAVDPVEKSLRDINLKLKNAERDQEFARKRMHDGNFSKDHNNRRRDGGRGGRDFRNRDRDNRGNDRRGNWNDRNRRDNNNVAPNGNVNPDAEEKFELKNLPETPVQDIEVTTAAPDLVPSDFGSEENMQHGRKFGDKRRMYTTEAQTEEETPSVVAEPVQDSGVQDKQEETQSASEETTADTEIRFGRR